MKKLILIAVAVITGCAQMYTPSTTLSPSAVDSVNGKKKEMFNAASRALVANGYQVTSSENHIARLPFHLSRGASL